MLFDSVLQNNPSAVDEYVQCVCETDQGWFVNSCQIKAWLRSNLTLNCVCLLNTPNQPIELVFMTWSCWTEINFTACFCLLFIVIPLFLSFSCISASADMLHWVILVVSHVTIVLFVSCDSQNGLNSLLACDLKWSGFVNGTYILYSLVFPQRGVSLQDVCCSI